MREAAKVKALEEWESLDAVAGRCVGALRSQLGERYAPAAVHLDAYQVYDPSGEQEVAVRRMRAFIAGMENVLREARGLVLYGSVGTGKDHLLAAALYHVAGAGIPAGFTSGEDIYLSIRDSMDSGEREERILRAYVQPPVLGISDPVTPRGQLGDWDARVLARVLDRRYRAFKPTWLTMNANEEAEAKAKLTPMVWDRLQEAAEIIPCFWRSCRSLRGKSASQVIAGKIG